MSLDIWLKVGEETVFEWNITHNLRRMAEEAGFAEAAWRPDCNGWSRASQIADTIFDGVSWLVRNREGAEVFNPSNGWGNYEGLLAFAFAYARACFDYPDAEIRVSR